MFVALTNLKYIPVHFLAIALGTGLILKGMSAQARTFILSNTNDDFTMSSLRIAVLAASALGGNNTIILDHASARKKVIDPTTLIFRLTRGGGDENKSRTGDLDIARGNLTIISPHTNAVIDASGLGDRIFEVFPKAHLSLINLTITGGHAVGDGFGSGYEHIPAAEAGGAIYNAGSLTLQNCIITGNASGNGNAFQGNIGGGNGGDGGGIYNTGKLTMVNCMVTDNVAGYGEDGASGGNGGSLKNDGVCWLTNCIFENNASGDGGAPEGNGFGGAGSGGNGGAIYNLGTLVLTGCVVSNNFAGAGKNGSAPGISQVDLVAGSPGGNGGSGAGIYNSGTLQLNCCTVSENLGGNGGEGHGSIGFKGGHGGTGGSGGGIYNNAFISLTNCTVSGNQCGNGNDAGSGASHGGDGGLGGNGGGIYNAGSLILFSSTVAGNTCGAGGDGGAWNNIFSRYGPGQGGNGGDGGRGGGIYLADQATASLRNTLIALNIAGDGGKGGFSDIFGDTTGGADGDSGVNNLGPDLFGDFTSKGFNLISVADDSTGFINGVNSDHVGNSAAPIDPLIGPLQMNSGLTPTHALLPGSPALDQGNSFGVSIDQRDQLRPYDDPFIQNAISGDGSDIGANESQP